MNRATQNTAKTCSTGKNAVCATIRWLLLPALFLLATAAAPQLYAEKLSQADLDALYQQAFGNKSQAKVPKSSQGQQVAVAQSGSSQQYDLDALYSQAFGKKRPPPPPGEAIESKPDESEGADMAALYAKAFGGKAASMPSKIAVDLRINDIEQGEVTVFSNSQGKMDRVAAGEILEILQSVLKEHIYSRIRKTFSGKQKIPFQALTLNGLKANYNAINLSLDLSVNPEMRKPRVVSMIGRKKATVREENRITASEISAFLNLYSKLEVESQDADKASVDVRLEGSVNVGDAVLESRLDYLNDEWELGRTTLTYDRPEKLQRFSVGHISTGNRNFQENLELSGIRLSKEFFMNPELQIRPRADESFVLDTDSEVEVFINGQLQQRFYLKQGIYTLQDIGLYDGVNDIRVRIKDEFGKVTEKSSRQYYDSHLLQPELSVYAINVGKLSNREAYRNEDLLNEPIFSGYYQRGLTENLTLSLDVQATQSRYLAGAEAIHSNLLGSFKFSFAASGGSDREKGHAARLEFRPNIQRQLISLDTLREDSLQLDTAIGKFLNSWTLSAEYRSENFSLLNDIPDLSQFDRRLRTQFQTQFGMNLGKDWRGSLSLSHSDYYDESNDFTAGLTATRRFNNGIRWSVGAHYDNENDFSVKTQITIPLTREKGNRRKEVDFLVNTRDNSYESRFSVGALSSLGKNSLAGNLEYQQNDFTRQQQLDLSYKDFYFDAQLYARNSEQRGSKSGSNQLLSVGLNTSLACVATSCAITRPISDSFALVDGPENLQGPVAINNGTGHFSYSGENSLPDSFTSLIPGKGRTGVVALDSYRYQRINIDETNLPTGYDPDAVEFEVFPRYHQGFHIKAGGEPAVTLDGVLVDSSAKPLPYKGGQLVSAADQNGENAIAFFSNKAGKFRVTSIKAGRYRMELFDYPDIMPLEISVPDKKGQVHDLGELRISQ